MLSLTPEVREALRWFQLLYELEVVDGRANWRRAGLPYGSAVGEVENQLMESLEFLRRVYDGISQVAVNKAMKSARLRAEQEAAARRRGAPTGRA